MKKSLFNTAMALCIGLFASCSQEEIITQSGNGAEETVNVLTELPNLAHTRALPGAAANHQLRCILEVWDKAENGKLITRIEKLATDASEGGKLQFSFSVPAATNYQCLLWADFIAADAVASPAESGNTKYADKYFDTANLKAIDFKVADASLFNNASSDAFCGAVDKNGTTSQLSVTLKRPFTKVTLTDKSEYIKECTSLGVEYLTPSGYNIADGTTTKTKAVKATGLTPTDKTWFSTFIFASANKTKLDQEIIMNVTKADGKTEKKTIKKDQISLDGNVENNAEANFSTDANVEIEVDVDGEMNDPNALKIGQFVNKDGSVSDAYDAEKAIGIVYAAAKGKTDTSEYGEGFVGKTIVGYAMALTSVTRSFLGANANDTNPLPELTSTGDQPWAENDYNGYTYSQALTTAFKDNTTSVLFNGYKTWLTNNAIADAQNLSSWYIPSGTQIKEIGSMLFGFKESSSAAVDETVKNSAFIAAYNTAVAGNPNAILDLGGATGACWILSSYCSTSNKGASLNVIVTNRAKDSSEIPSVSTNFPTWEAKSRPALRPVLTIFKQ